MMHMISSGIFNTVNLNLYHYAGNNPVKLVDPDGNWIQLAPVAAAVVYFASTPAGQHLIRQAPTIARWAQSQGAQLLSRAGPAIANNAPQLLHAARGLVDKGNKTNINWSGKAHGVPAHMNRILSEVKNMACSGKYSEIFINKSLKTAGISNSGLKPDITAIGKGGNPNMIVEVVSPSQTVPQLLDKMQGMVKDLPNTMGKVVKP